MDIESRFSQESFEPICKFGPGGEYVSNWPAGFAGTRQPDLGPLGKVLEKIANLLGRNMNSGLSDAHGDGRTRSLDGAVDNSHMEDSKIGTTTGSFDAKAVGGSSAHRPVSREAMLFDDCSGVGRGSGRKPHNRVRTHRRAKRKKASFGGSWQGTLFEIDTAGTKVA